MASTHCLTRTREASTSERSHKQVAAAGRRIADSAHGPKPQRARKSHDARRGGVGARHGGGKTRRGASRDFPPFSTRHLYRGIPVLGLRAHAGVVAKGQRTERSEVVQGCIIADCGRQSFGSLVGLKGGRVAECQDCEECASRVYPGVKVEMLL